MAKLRREMDRRMLGNGYRARPVELDCHFESICESCTFFVTTIEFKPTRQRQWEDAASKDQLGRKRIFEGLLDRLAQDAASHDLGTRDKPATSHDERTQGRCRRRPPGVPGRQLGPPSALATTSYPSLWPALP